MTDTRNIHESMIDDYSQGQDAALLCRLGLGKFPTAIQNLGSRTI